MGDARVDERSGTDPTPAARRHPAIPTEFDQNNEPAGGTPTAATRRPRSRARWLLTAGLVISALLVGYYVVSLWQVHSAGTSDQARQVDAIVVMGAAQYDGRPSPQLTARLDHVVTLWPEGLAPLIVVTGGNQPGDRFTEADASAAYLIERGVPDSAILREDRGATSYESLERVAVLLDERSAGKHSVLVVTDPYHTLRSS